MLLPSRRRPCVAAGAAPPARAAPRGACGCTRGPRSSSRAPARWAR
uniref:CAP-Gly domain containing linker protein family member 4 n=1 Tax=Rousettus aegyptiacus TaxID=9407 RepID=A0A7J8FEX0_ROUAE|nr:CAP-Gly domain containing linker protein family member 4 [Rousettus aegyptiacus]